MSLSYLTGTYRTNLLKDVEADIQAESQKLSSNFSQQVSDLKGTMSGQTVTAEENDFSTHSLTAGQQFTVQAGGEVLVLSGTVKAVGSGLTDVTAGTEVSAGGSLTANHLYVAGADCVLEATARPSCWQSNGISRHLPHIHGTWRTGGVLNRYTYPCVTAAIPSAMPQ